MRVLLLAAGSQSRWQAEGGEGLKQFIEIDGEAVVHRAYRLAAARCPDIITLVRDPSDRCWAGLNPEAPQHEDWMGEMGKFLDGRPHWPVGGEVAILYGDVFYTEAVLDQILDPAPVDQPTVYGRANAPGRRLESFGFRFDVLRDAAEVERVCRECAEQGMNVKGGPWRWFHRRHLGLGRYDARDVKRLATPENGWVELPPDATDDFDRPKDLTKWRRRFDVRDDR